MEEGEGMREGEGREGEKGELVMSSAFFFPKVQCRFGDTLYPAATHLESWITSVW